MSAAPPPRVSVLLPVRNAAGTLAESIGSISAQTFRAWELLVLDDGSEDASPAIAEAAAALDARIRVQRLPARGIVSALSAGVAAARGEFVARMDADDISAPGRLEAQVAWLDAHPGTGLVGCRVRFGGDPVSAAGYALHVDWLNSLCSAEQIRRERFVESPFAHPSVCFRRALVERHGGYRDGDFPEDYELWLRWLEAGVRMEKVPETLLEWNDPPGRLSRLDDRYAPEAFFRIKGAYIAAEVERMFLRAGKRRAVWVWGAGRPTRKRARWVEAAGLTVSGFIDIDPKKTNRHLGPARIPVRSADELPPPDDSFILVYVANRGARQLIRGRLVEAGFLEEQDFLVCA